MDGIDEVFLQDEVSRLLYAIFRLLQTCQCKSFDLGRVCLAVSCIQFKMHVVEYNTSSSTANSETSYTLWLVTQTGAETKRRWQGCIIERQEPVLIIWWPGPAPEIIEDTLFEFSNTYFFHKTCWCYMIVHTINVVKCTIFVIKLTCWQIRNLIFTSMIFWIEWKRICQECPLLESATVFVINHLLLTEATSNLSNSADSSIWRSFAM